MRYKTFCSVLSLLNWKFAIGFILLQQIVKKLSWNFSRRQNDSLLGPTTGYADCEKKLWQQNVYTAFWIRVIFFQPCMPIRKVSFPSLFVATLQNSLQSFLTEQHENILKWNAERTISSLQRGEFGNCGIRRTHFSMEIFSFR